MHSTLATVPKRGLILLMGDFKAKVGGANKAIDHVIDNHGVTEMKENGEVLVECCGLNPSSTTMVIP